MQEATNSTNESPFGNACSIYAENKVGVSRWLSEPGAEEAAKLPTGAGA